MSEDQLRGGKLPTSDTKTLKTEDYKNNQEIRRSPVKDTDEFIWDEDLSENAQKLYLFLLGDTGFVEILPELAKIENIDLDSGLAELRRHNVLDESDPTIILLNIIKH